MPSLSDWKVPASVQPKPEDYAYDLDTALRRGGRRARHHSGRRLHRRDARHRARRQRRADPRRRPGADHRLSDHRGRDDLAQSERRPRGARPRAWPTTRRPASAWSRRWPGSTCRRCRSASPRAASVGERVVVGGAGGRQRSVAARIVAKQEFAGYWEYVLDEAIFTAPAHPNWGGTALIGPAGDLLGIGSLQLQHGREKGQARRHQHDRADRSAEADPRRPDDARPAATRRRGRGSGSTPPRSRTRLVIVGLAEQGPAQKADLRTGDIVLSVAGEEVRDLAELLPPGLVARAKPASTCRSRSTATATPWTCASSRATAIGSSRGRACIECAVSRAQRCTTSCCTASGNADDYRVSNNARNPSR